MVALAPSDMVMPPFIIASVVVIDEATETEIAGAEQALVVKVWSILRPTPAELSAKA
jgi:hypothetical protein